MSKSRGSSQAGEHRPSLVAQLAAAVARRDVGQREQLHLGVRRDLRCLRSGRVSGQARPIALLLPEGRLMDQQVGRVGGDRERLAGRGVAGDDDLAARARLADHLLGAHAGNGLAALQASEIGSGRDAQYRRELGVEASRPRVLDQHVAIGEHAVAHVDGVNLERVAADRLAGLEFDHLEREAELAVHAPHRAHQLGDAGGPVDRQRTFAIAQVEGLQQPRQPEPMIDVQVGDEDVREVAQPA